MEAFTICYDSKTAIVSAVEKGTVQYYPNGWKKTPYYVLKYDGVEKNGIAISIIKCQNFGIQKELQNIVVRPGNADEAVKKLEELLKSE